MANGTGAAIAGLIIGIVIATQAGDFESADIDLPDNADSDQSEGTDSDQSDGTDGDRSDNADSAPADVPTQFDGGSTGVAMPGAVTSVNGSAKVVALTFSSSPDPAYTADILDILDRHGVPATFCVAGEQARDNPELIRRIAEEGHALCNQGLTQDPQLADRDDAAIQSEIEGGRDAIQAAGPDVTVPFFRASGGAFSPRVNDIAEAYGHTPLGWSLDPGDWEQLDASPLVDEVIPGDVIVLHDGGGDRSDTVAALYTLITDLRDEGYEIVVP
jgi:peptidoglycan/xylan/chitin deacetylase (PgdA/CDA1 family)